MSYYFVQLAVCYINLALLCCEHSVELIKFLKFFLLLCFLLFQQFCFFFELLLLLCDHLLLYFGFELLLFDQKLFNFFLLLSDFGLQLSRHLLFFHQKPVLLVDVSLNDLTVYQLEGALDRLNLLQNLPVLLLEVLFQEAGGLLKLGVCRAFFVPEIKVHPRQALVYHLLLVVVQAVDLRKRSELAGVQEQQLVILVLEGERVVHGRSAKPAKQIL